MGASGKMERPWGNSVTRFRWTCSLLHPFSKCPPPSLAHLSSPSYFHTFLHRICSYTTTLRFHICSEQLPDRVQVLEQGFVPTRHQLPKSAHLQLVRSNEPQGDWLLNSPGTKKLASRDPDYGQGASQQKPAVLQYQVDLCHVGKPAQVC